LERNRGIGTDHVEGLGFQKEEKEERKKSRVSGGGRKKEERVVWDGPSLGVIAGPQLRMEWIKNAG